NYSYNIESNYSRINKIEGIVHDVYKNIYINTTKQGQPPSYSFNNLATGGTNFGGRPQGIENIFLLLKSKIVFISGTRHVPEFQSTELHQSLTIDGTNLNAFLYTLHNNQETRFDEIKSVFKQIFNDVTSISTPINDGKQTYTCLYFEGNPEPIPLYNCGSGFTHVLLLLCVLFTKENSIVLFDEPHVFLHPSAEKAIYDLMSETNHHQYILTTHSPILINYPCDKNVFHVKKENGVSDFSGLDTIQELLSGIGINNSDFALSDKVLFVEGETEEAIIPKILGHFGMKQIGYNYRILKMKGTGNEFSKKSAMTRNKEKLDLILSGISTSPIPYKILIDSDEKTDEKMKQIEDKYGDSVLILERREIENYFLDCYEELSEVININIGAEVSNSGEIESFIEELLTRTDNKKLFPRVGVANSIKSIIGSQALELLFEKYELSYNKIIHGVQITNLVLQNQPEKLSFLKDKLEDFIKTS
ncbi:ATP-dependent nuclease, partial [Peribacillus butanolivorans]|uniref:ATP-dependent nuclease n=1 Tax=Peribacillus butanolivorans TaxID=421767 RepID=UPI003647CD68